MTAADSVRLAIVTYDPEVEEEKRTQTQDAIDDFVEVMVEAFIDFLKS